MSQLATDTFIVDEVGESSLFLGENFFALFSTKASDQQAACS